MKIPTWAWIAVAVIAVWYVWSIAAKARARPVQTTVTDPALTAPLPMGAPSSDGLAGLERYVFG